jgi:glycosyltransferase involved in cell wall biosynthesis
MAIFAKKKQKTMKLSIITVNFNDAEGLEHTIKSVISQTFHDYEFIVIDGGSTDGSVDVIKKYEDHINYWVSEHDGGIYAGMNKGLRQQKENM